MLFYCIIVCRNLLTPKNVCRPAAEERTTVKNMKQKYSITVADMELNIISDASPDEVENIVGMLDRRMRDINLKSPRCTKNEAAILCALAYCSERMAMQEAFKKVEKDAFRFSAENEKLKKTIESLQEEVDNLRKDASVMRSILDHAAAANTPAKEEKVYSRVSAGMITYGDKIDAASTVLLAKKFAPQHYT